MSDAMQRSDAAELGSGDAEKSNQPLISKAGKVIIGSLLVLALSGAAVTSAAPSVLGPIVEMLPASIFPAPQAMQPKGFDGGGPG